MEEPKTASDADLTEALRKLSKEHGDSLGTPEDQDQEAVRQDQAPREDVAEPERTRPEIGDEFIPRFIRGEKIPVKGFWFEVLGVTKGEGNLVLRMNGPTGSLLKRMAKARKDAKNRQIG